MKRRKEFYEELWEKVIQHIENGDYQEYSHREVDKPKFTLLDTFLATVSLKESILEIGCGSGHVLSYFKDKCNSSRACGIDISRRAVTFAQEHYRDSGFFVHNIDEEDLPFKDSEFDIVLLCDIVEHVRDYDHLLREAIRVGKHVTLKVPLEHTCLEYVLTMCGKKTSINKKSPVGHIHSFSLGHFRKYFGLLQKEMAIDVEMVNEKGLPLDSSFWILRTVSKWLYNTPFYRFIFCTQLGIHIAKQTRVENHDHQLKL